MGESWGFLFGEDDQKPGDGLISLLRRLRDSAFARFEVVNEWVDRRSTTTQLIIGALVTLGAGAVQSEVPSIVLNAQLPTFGTNQILIALVGIIAGQTVIQTQKLNQVVEETKNVSRSAARSDGGKNLPPRDDEGKFEEDGTSGGGALGGAIAGAAFGSSFGPAGTVGGAVFGAIIGDALEEQADD
jgi:hypothetical protein